jgi:hypothetical protein
MRDETRRDALSEEATRRFARRKALVDARPSLRVDGCARALR